MIVSCPSCSTRFVVDPSLLGADGRRVRCARCGHVWHQKPDTSTVVRLTPPEQLAPRPIPPGSNLPVIHQAQPTRLDRGWITFGFAVVLLFITVFLGQDLIVRAWPPAERLYRTIGMAEPIAGEGLEIRDVTAETRVAEGNRLITVTGTVANTADGPTKVPRVRVGLVDQTGTVLASVGTEIGRVSLNEGESGQFSVEFSRPPENAARILVDFAPAAGN